MEDRSIEALSQISVRSYKQGLMDNGVTHVLDHDVAFFKNTAKFRSTGWSCKKDTAKTMAWLK